MIKILLLLIVLVFKILEILKVCWNLFCSYVGHICFGILSVLGGEGIFVFISLWLNLSGVLGNFVFRCFGIFLSLDLAKFFRWYG